VFELGNAQPAFADLRQAMSRFLQQLTVLSGETVHLGVLDGSEVVYLDKIETPQSAGVPSQVGRRNPAHCTGLGKALVAWNSAQHDVLVAQDSLPVFTAHTISTGRALAQELKRVRAERVAYDREERILGIACVATPVMGRNSVVAALSVSGPRSRMTDDRLRELSMPVERVGTAAGNYLRQRFQL
jgi:DNA-binding IclR family transcriptional regulator